MAASKYLRQGNLPGTYQEVTATVTSAGSNSAGAILALGEDGLIDPTVLPSGLGATIVVAKATEALTAGCFVRVSTATNNVPNVKKALASDINGAATGFVLSTVAAGATVNVYTDGLNTLIPKPATGWDSAQIGLEVCLSATASGECTLTPPATPTGCIVQPLGTVMSVGPSFIVVNFVPKNIVVRA